MNTTTTQQGMQMTIPVVLCFLIFSGFCTIGNAQVGTKFSGLASYYGVPFHGRATASGEIFSMDSMTAAHKQLAFGTLVKVTNRSNGKACVVKINDRGPYIDGRIIDVSKAAAETLDFIAQGVVTVDCEIVGTGTINRPLLAAKTHKNTQPKDHVAEAVIKPDFETETKSADTKTARYTPREAIKYETTSPDSTTFYSVQLGSFGMQQNAELLLKKVGGKYPEARIMQADVYGKIWFRVLCGKCASIEEASKLKNSLSAFYPQCFLVKFGHPEQQIEMKE